MSRGIHHVEFYVGNAFASAYFFTHALGFRPLAQAGLETGLRDRQSFAVEQGSIRLIFTNSLDPGGPIADHVRVHGDGIRDVALAVDDAEEAFVRCVDAGAAPLEEPHEASDEFGTVSKATIGTFGDTIHSLVQRGRYDGPLLPGFKPWRTPGHARSASIAAIDHVACCIEGGTMPKWMEFYERGFGFREVHHEDIVTAHSAMNSKVIGNDDGTIKLPLMEPAPGRSKSQIEEYLEYHHGPGAQHIALLSSDITTSVRSMREGAVEFLETPREYYDTLPSRVGAIDEEIDVLRDLNVLVDRDRWGYLLQVFTKPITGRPTGFLEIVQRKGARGFGGGNVRALFEAVERAQAARGNL